MYPYSIFFLPCCTQRKHDTKERRETGFFLRNTKTVALLYDLGNNSLITNSFLKQHLLLLYRGRHDNPLQCSCLENLTDRGACQAKHTPPCADEGLRFSLTSGWPQQRFRPACWRYMGFIRTKLNVQTHLIFFSSDVTRERCGFAASRRGYFVSMKPEFWPFSLILKRTAHSMQKWQFLVSGITLKSSKEISAPNTGKYFTS